MWFHGSYDQQFFTELFLGLPFATFLWKSSTTTNYGALQFIQRKNTLKWILGFALHLRSQQTPLYYSWFVRSKLTERNCERVHDAGETYR
jgi:hypothetical protein